METDQLHRGRLIDHLHLIVEDLPKCLEFYQAVLGALNIPMGDIADDHFWADELFVSSKDSHAALGQLTGRHHLAFQADSTDTVEAFYRAGLAAGGTDNGAPGHRPYHPGYYAAFLIDPAGNNIEAVYHGPSHRSVASVVVKF